MSKSNLTHGILRREMRASLSDRFSRLTGFSRPTTIVVALRVRPSWVWRLTRAGSNDHASPSGSRGQKPTTIVSGAPSSGSERKGSVKSPGRGMIGRGNPIAVPILMVVIICRFRTLIERVWLGSSRETVLEF